MCFHSFPHTSSRLATILLFSPREKERANFTLGRRMQDTGEVQKRQEGGGKSLLLPNPIECGKEMKGGKSRSPKRDIREVWLCSQP